MDSNSTLDYVTFDKDEEFELALKLSKEFSDSAPSASRADSVTFDEDKDLELALKLSKEFSNSVQSTSCTGSVTFDEDKDLELALKLSKEFSNNVPSASRADFVKLDEDEDLKLAVKLHEELNRANNDLPNTSSNSETAMNVVFNVDEDFELALKLSKESNDGRMNLPFSSHPTDVRIFDEDDDFKLAIKLSDELNSNYNVNSHLKGKLYDENFAHENTRKKTEFTSHNADVIIERIVKDLIASEDEKVAKRLSANSFNFPQTPVQNSDTLRKYLNKEISVVDPSWETIDPNPDIFALFMAFNRRFFWGQLDMVEVKWSPRMTLCAGICTYQKRAGHCIVKLSKPLLQLRPRKDLVETLLHEMIHAYLFVSNNDRDRDGHGPRFHSHMHRINRESGANITVYHNFHDEVRYYKQHEWRCNGPCRDRPPYYGYVRRASNRTPGSNDQWWADHAATCGGEFVKTKEPEGYQKNLAVVKQASKIKNKKSKNSIENYFKSPSIKIINPAFDPSVVPTKFPTGLKITTTYNTAKNTNPRIFTLNDLSSNKRNSTNSQTPSSSPKKWAPLPGQTNIVNFINKS